MNTKGKLEFYPKHPSDLKTTIIETRAMPILAQEMPVPVKELQAFFLQDADRFYEKYVDKRFEVTGIAKKVGPDIHNKPSIEISDSVEGQTYALVIFPTDDHYSKVSVGDTVVVRANYLVMSNHFGLVMKYSELVSEEKTKNDAEIREKTVLNYPFFDGEQIVENRAVVMEKGVITDVVESNCINRECFLMPGLLDAHTHMSTNMQVDAMITCGVTGTCDVAASDSLIENAKPFSIVSSLGMTMGTLNGASYVKKAIESGARYIKVLLVEPNVMLKNVLKEICREAHASNLKVAVHATSVKAVQLAVSCDVDILIHVPMKEELPESLVTVIAEKGIAVAPTLVMMETFSTSGRNGYQPDQYSNAEKGVRRLYDHGVSILAATDANPGTFAPAVAHGTSMHRELELLVKAGMKPVDVLASATSSVADVFEIEGVGRIQKGKRANLVLVEGRPDQKITDITKIKQVWIDGKPVM